MLYRASLPFAESSPFGKNLAIMDMRGIMVRYEKANTALLLQIYIYELSQHSLTGFSRRLYSV